MVDMFADKCMCVVLRSVVSWLRKPDCVGPFHLALTEGCGHYTIYSITPCDASSCFEWQQKWLCCICSVAKTISNYTAVFQIHKHYAY